ncbi:MAG: ATP synthase F1 subunit epsilon, partial [Eubacterium sp.]|nr:ATP synthase F1 subunit epsilon [Eubacterium sp.]
MNTFQLKIIASNRTFFDGEAQQLVVPLVDGGSQGFLAKHENCVVPIDSGEMK